MRQHGATQDRACDEIDRRTWAPICVRCGKRMLLQSMAPGAVGVPLEQFVCTCGNSVTVPWSPRRTR